MAHNTERADWHNSRHRELDETISWLQRHPEVRPNATNSDAMVQIAMEDRKENA